MPDQIGANKAISAGFFGALTIFVVWVAQAAFGLAVPPEVASAFTVIMSTAATYFTPHGAPAPPLPPRSMSWIVAPFAGAAVLLGLSACASLPAPDPSRTAAIEQKIVAACLQSGLFKLAGGVVASAVPAANLPIAVVNAGVDQVCADPHRFAGDVTTVEWVAKNLAGQVPIPRS